MNIDDLKDAWNDDEPSGMRLPVSTAHFGKTSSAVGKIRRNMKRESIATMVCYFLMLLFLFTYQQNPFFFATASVLILTLIIPNAYYFFRFYVFYKSIGRFDLNIKSSIQKVTYELELNIELYKAYNLCITPIAVLIVFALACGKKTTDYIQYIMSANLTISPWMMLWIFLTVLISFVITYACIIYSVRCLYGKYLYELKQTMEDLGTEDQIA